MTEGVAIAADDTLLGHPKALFVLFFAEMWERFSFYGMRALLIFYLTQHFLFGDREASAIYATYGSLVYLMPVIGGLVADRYLGFRRAVTLGAVLLCIGHLGMAYEGSAASLVDGTVVRDGVSLQAFYLSVAFIIIGCGFLKPSISNMVGQLYGADDPRRDSGFTIFYMGINLGAVSASLLCGYLGQTYGWAYGFGLAGIGMLAGLITFVRGRHLFQGAGEAPPDARLGERVGPLSRFAWIVIGSLAGVMVASQLMQQHALVGSLLTLTAAGVVIGIVWFSVTRCTPEERDRMLVVLYLTAVSVVFWSFFEQAGSSMNLFADRNVDRSLLGFELQASQFQALNPGYIIAFAPIFSWLWTALERRGLQPSTPAKFGLGVVQVGLGFGALLVGIQQAGADGQVAMLWLALAYLLHTTGELCVSPVGLSMVTRLSVTRVVGLMMGVWFLSSAFSHYVAGIIAASASVQEAPGAELVAAEALPVYADTFGFLAIVAVCVGVVVLVTAPLVRRFMHGRR